MASRQFNQLIKMFESMPRSDGLDVEQMRGAYERLGSMFSAPEGTRNEPVDAGGVHAEWVCAGGVGDAAPILMYLHGGGYVIGSISTHRHLLGHLSAAVGARVLGLDYRLAPEHPHPAALDDAVAAYRWLLTEGHSPSRIVIAGDSAGGGLAVATLVALREAGDPLPAAAALLSPWADLAAEGESIHARAALDPMVQREGLLEMAARYVAGSDPKTPLCSPIHADLKGLPPLLVHVGTRETLYDDSTRLVAKAKEAGVEVTFEPWEDMIHVWHFFAPMLPEANDANLRIGEFFREYLVRPVRARGAHSPGTK